MSEKHEETTQKPYETPEVVEIAKAEEITLGSCNCNPDLFTGGRQAASTTFDE